MALFPHIARIHEVAGRLAGAKSGNFRIATLSRLNVLADQRRDYMRFLEIKIVPFPIDVAGNKNNGIQAVLFAVCPRLDQQRFFATE